MYSGLASEITTTDQQPNVKKNVINSTTLHHSCPPITAQTTPIAHNGSSSNNNGDHSANTTPMREISRSPQTQSQPFHANSPSAVGVFHSTSGLDHHYGGLLHRSPARQNGSLSPAQPVRSRSAAEAALTSPNARPPLTTSVSRGQLLSPQALKLPIAEGGGMAIGIALPAQLTPSENCLHVEENNSAGELEVEKMEVSPTVAEEKLGGLLMVGKLHHKVVDSSTHLDSIISDVVESVAQERGATFNGDAASMDAQPDLVAVTTASAHPTRSNANNHGRNSRTYFRAPGLQAPNMEAVAGAANSNIWICPVCSFSCTSKFHYNSHMNTHSDHSCPICSYTSRTEGRLRKHIKDAHNRLEKMKVGIVDPADAALEMGMDVVGSSEPISTTMASILNIVNRAAVTSGQKGSLINAADPCDANGEGQANNKNSHAIGGSFEGLSALDRIRALTERNLLSASQEELNGASSMLMMANGGSGANGLVEKASVVSSSATNPTPPKRAGKPKSYKCKTCDHVSKSKEEQWEHARVHIPADKQLTCQYPHCRFITEYKHHLEYHYRNHMGSKPFKCTQCKYDCVNKSMLNSHMKSHNRIYQFRCQDCPYKTKYCHSLKMHTRKYGHRKNDMGHESYDEEMPESDDSANNSFLQQHLHQGVLQDPFSMVTTTASNTTTSGDEDHPSSNGSLAGGVLLGTNSHKKEEITAQSGVVISKPTTLHPTLNSMLLQQMQHRQQQQQQMAGIPSSPAQVSANIPQAGGLPPSDLPTTNHSTIQQYASQLLLRQQHLEIMQRAAAATVNVFQCQHCDFQTPSSEKLIRHNLHHLFMNHQQQHQAEQSLLNEHQLANNNPQAALLSQLYHNLAAAQQHQQQHPQFESPPPQQQQQQQLLTTAAQPQSSSLEQLLNGNGMGAPMDLAAAARFQQELAMRLQQQHREEEDEQQRKKAAAIANALAELHQRQGQFQQSLQQQQQAGGGGHIGVEYGGAITSTASEQHALGGVRDQAMGENGELQLPSHPCEEDAGSPSTESKSTSRTDGGGITDTGSPSSDVTAGGCGSRKQRKPSKTSKVDQISVRLQTKTSPPGNAGDDAAACDSVGMDNVQFNGNVLPSTSSPSSTFFPADSANVRLAGGVGENGCDEKTMTAEATVTSLLMRLNQDRYTSAQADSATDEAAVFGGVQSLPAMPYTCQHCKLGFQDRALYQIHLGYHGYESPFKCNRCGHQSASSLEFNLHLYQAKHD